MKLDGCTSLTFRAHQAIDRIAPKIRRDATIDEDERIILGFPFSNPPEESPPPAEPPPPSDQLQIVLIQESIPVPPNSKNNGQAPRSDTVLFEGSLSKKADDSGTVKKPPLPPVILPLTDTKEQGQIDNSSSPKTPKTSFIPLIALFAGFGIISFLSRWVTSIKETNIAPALKIFGDAGAIISGVVLGTGVIAEAGSSPQAHRVTSHSRT